MAAQSVTGSIEQRVALARARRTPHETLFDLVTDPSAEVRAALAARSGASAQVLRALARDRNREVRQAVARNPDASQGTLLRLLGDTDRHVRWAVATNPACDNRVRGVMLKAQDKELRGLLAELPSLEADYATELVSDASPEVRERLAARTAHPEIIEALLEDRTVRVRKGLARNEWTSPEQRHRLATDYAPEVRATLVRAVELDEPDLRALLEDRSAEVRLALATSDRTPPEIREALTRDADEQVAQAARGYRPGPARQTAPTRENAPARENVPTRAVTGRAGRRPATRGFPGRKAR
ncbi:hypothetical protein [Symbioplanes lichenis]|uniref:hypothetical protein n=1 Tax=Symbioplanes lichenis TaxID=1629072 RepID=UPI0027383E33|nr:hypothetical protein [Actinoplanes lichenis]